MSETDKPADNSVGKSPEQERREAAAPGSDTQKERAEQAAAPRDPAVAGTQDNPVAGPEPVTEGEVLAAGAEQSGALDNPLHPHLAAVLAADPTDAPVIETRQGIGARAAARAIPPASAGCNGSSRCPAARPRRSVVGSMTWPTGSPNWCRTSRPVC